MLCGIAAHLLLVGALVLKAQLFGALGFGEIAWKIHDRIDRNHPTLAGAGGIMLNVAGVSRAKSFAAQDLPDFPGPEKWPAQGVVAAGLDRQSYDRLGAPLQSPVGPGNPPASQRRVVVSDSDTLIAAVRTARTGDEIVIEPGTYRLAVRNIGLGAAGTATKPIHLRARRFGEVLLELDSLEGFLVNKPYWVFENLRIRGACRKDSQCEHAFHVVGDARGTVIRNNEIVDFNAALKVNVLRIRGVQRFPDLGLVQNNTVYNTRRRDTENPVALLNINAANGWVVSANFIADFGKGRGNKVSYGAYMKGNSESGLFERNLIVCQWRVPVDRDTRVGLSFGGGGTGNRFCRDGDCRREHTGGVMRNNIIARCPTDVGVYLNRATHAQIHNNLLIGNKGIDIRFDTGSASIHNNIIDGDIRDRDGATHSADNNLTPSACNPISRLLGRCDPRRVYLAPLAGDFRLIDDSSIRDMGNHDVPGQRDFCGNTRTGRQDLGPIEYGAERNCLPR